MKRPLPSIAIAACSFGLPKLEGDSLWLQVTPAGAFAPSDGRAIDVPAWRLDAASASALIERFKARQTPPVLDYEHQTLHKEANGQPAPAAGWFRELEWRDGQGLFARVDLTARAKTLIEAGEYAFFSPVFSYAPDGTVLALHMGALTNNPAIDGMEPLARRAAATFGLHSLSEVAPVTEEELKALRKALGLADTATVAEVMAAVEALNAKADQTAGDANSAVAALSSLRTTLGLPATASGETIAAATAALKAGAKPDPAQYVPVAAVTELQSQVAALSARLNGGEVDGLVKSAMADGRLLPALEPWARDLGGKDLGQLKAYLDKAPKIAALSGMQGQPPTDDNTGLNAEQLAVCSAMGIKPADFLATLKA
jgi:phage I-like protein